MPHRKNSDSMVGISLHMPMEMLETIDNTIEGKTMSEKLRNCITHGLEAIQQKGIGEPPKPIPPLH